MDTKMSNLKNLASISLLTSGLRLSQNTSVAIPTLSTNYILHYYVPGITPMLQLIREVFKHPEDKTELSIIFANQVQTSFTDI